jgi:hypothetical protein
MQRYHLLKKDISTPREKRLAGHFRVESRLLLLGIGALRDVRYGPRLIRLRKR